MNLLAKINPSRGRPLSLRDKARRGVTAVEFALIAPVLVLFITGILELSLMLLALHVIENATYNSSRLAKTGYVAQGQTQEETVLAVLHERLSGLSPLIDMSKVTMTSTAYGDLSSIGQPEQGVESSLGTPEQVVVYTVTYPWEMFTPIIGNIMGDENGILELSSRIVVRNEPYD